MRSYLRAASTHWRPSNTLWLHGFSTYTSLPAWQAQIVISECQWLQVAIETRVEVLVLQSLADVLHALGRVAALLFDLLRAALEQRGGPGRSGT